MDIYFNLRIPTTRVSTNIENLATQFFIHLRKNKIETKNSILFTYIFFLFHFKKVGLHDAYFVCFCKA